MPENARLMNFMRISTCWNSSKDNTRSITKMMKTNWNVMVSLRNRKHVSQSMMIKANNKIICHLKEDQSEFLEECRRKNLAPKCNVKRSGGLILADCVDLSGYVTDDGRVSAGYHEKSRQGSHVKRVTTSESMSQNSGYEPNNVSNGLKHLRTHETMSVSRMKCGHPGNYHVKRVLTRSSRLHVRMSKNLSYRLKVKEFASLVRQSLCPGGKGDKPNSVWSGLKHLRIPE